jgi:DNA end-binding protein Ku
MQKTSKAAVSRFTFHNKRRLSVIRPAGTALSLSTMYFADEVVALEQLEDLPPLAADPAPRELRMAEQLIESLSVDFDPAQYHDDFRDRMMDLIGRKSEGEATGDEGAKVIDLMAALEASLAAVKKKAPAREGAKQARAR